ncbi:hypothetical protein ABNavy71_123 [Acinetobacter phage AB-Navy71]|nr:hypothetical protein ABNavy71_123 [Acinetobacter phage AB-Navy71]
MKQFMQGVDSRIRTSPKSVSEMYKWGMISFPMYNKVKHLPLETAIAAIEEEAGWQTYTVHADQIIEYCTNWKDYPGNYERNDWIRHCLKLCGGKINFESCLHAYYHFV